MLRLDVSLVNVMKLELYLKIVILLVEYVNVEWEWKDFIVMPANICIMDFLPMAVKVSGFIIIYKHWFLYSSSECINLSSLGNYTNISVLYIA